MDIMIYEENVAALYVESAFAHGRPTYIHPEDGQSCIDYSIEETFYIYLDTKYGIQWRHRHAFSTQEAAYYISAKIEEALKKGQPANLGKYWDRIRVIYGTQAYLDEEPYIVQRERDDALWNEFFGNR